MRLLFVVQRYGQDVAGGAEAHCREFATRLSRRGHEVEVLSTCALSYVDWANHYEPGVEVVDGVTLHRLLVDRPRDNEMFGRFNSGVAWGNKPVPLYLQEQWMNEQGPHVPELVPWLEDHAGNYDVAIFFTYLYFTTWAGLPAAAGRVPTVLHPTAHDEPPFQLPIFDTMFRMPRAFAFSTEEEGILVRRRTGALRPSDVIGIGVDLDIPADADPTSFRDVFGLGDRPYLLFLGRVVPDKGAHELFDHFTHYKKRNPGPLGLVFVGEAVVPMPDHPDVVVTGFVDDKVRHDALAGALALAQPSYFESFSMVLTEAWAHRRPVLVQGCCAVLAGQARRSGGAIPYQGFAEFEAAIDMLIDDPRIGDELGAAGRRYIEKNYEWDVVLRRYEELLEGVVSTASDTS